MSHPHEDHVAPRDRRRWRPCCLIVGTPGPPGWTASARRPERQRRSRPDGIPPDGGRRLPAAPQPARGVRPALSRSRRGSSPASARSSQVTAPTAERRPTPTGNVRPPIIGPALPQLGAGHRRRHLGRRRRRRPRRRPHAVHPRHLAGLRPRRQRRRGRRSPQHLRRRPHRRRLPLRRRRAPWPPKPTGGEGYSPTTTRPPTSTRSSTPPTRYQAADASASVQIAGSTVVLVHVPGIGLTNASWAPQVRAAARSSRSRRRHPHRQLLPRPRPADRPPPSPLRHQPLRRSTRCPPASAAPRPPALAPPATSKASPSTSTTARAGRPRATAGSRVHAARFGIVQPAVGALALERRRSIDARSPRGITKHRRHPAG